MSHDNCDQVEIVDQVGGGLLPEEHSYTLSIANHRSKGKKERKRKHTSQVGKGLGKRKKTVSKKKPAKEKTSRKRRRTSCIPKRKPTKKKTKTKVGRTTKRKACKK